MPPWISVQNDFSYFFIYKSPQCFLPSFKSIGLSVQEKETIDFQDGHHGGPLWFPIRMILVTFNLQVSPMLPTKFQVNWPFSSEEGKIHVDIQDGDHSGHLGFPIGTILAFFDLQVSPMLNPTKFQVNWPFSSGEEVKRRFSRWGPQRLSWISDRNEFSYFWFTSRPDASYQVSSQLAKGCKRSRLLKKLLTPHGGGQTLIDHNSSPRAPRAQVS